MIFSSRNFIPLESQAPHIQSPKKNRNLYYQVHGVVFFRLSEHFPSLRDGRVSESARYPRCGAAVHTTLKYSILMEVLMCHRNSQNAMALPSVPYSPARTHRARPSFIDLGLLPWTSNSAPLFDRLRTFKDGAFLFSNLVLLLLWVRH